MTPPCIGVKGGCVLFPLLFGRPTFGGLACRLTRVSVDKLLTASSVGFFAITRFIIRPRPGSATSVHLVDCRCDRGEIPSRKTLHTVVAVGMFMPFVERSGEFFSARYLNHAELFQSILTRRAISNPDGGKYTMVRSTAKRSYDRFFPPPACP